MSGSTEPVNVMIVNVEVAIVRDGHYLLAERGPGETYGAGWLSMPGGKLDWIDSEQDALELTSRRETLEETGIILGPDIVYVESHTFGTDDPCLDIVMLAQPDANSPDPHISDPDEVATLEWLTLEQAAADPRVQPWTITSLERADVVRQRMGW